MREKWKAAVSFAVCLCMAFAVFYGCDGKDNEPDDTYVGPKVSDYWKEDEALKILFIGNSFSMDCAEFVYPIAESAGVKDVKVGNLYIGGCSLKMHATNAAFNLPEYEYYVNDDGEWKQPVKSTIKDAVESDNWDYISMQQASGDSGIADTYADLDKLISYVTEWAGEKTELVWHMTWAYQQDSNHKDFSRYKDNQMTMYNAIVNTVKSVILPREDICTVIPCGTAVQNARTSFMGDRLTRDGYHLNLTYGRYLAGLAVFYALTGMPIDDLAFAPGGIAGEGKKMLIECAKDAVNKPFEITQSKYTELPQ